MRSSAYLEEEEDILAEVKKEKEETKRDDDGGSVMEEEREIKPSYSKTSQKPPARVERMELPLKS
jgi:hypothetical protein